MVNWLLLWYYVSLFSSVGNYFAQVFAKCYFASVYEHGSGGASFASTGIQCSTFSSFASRCWFVFFWCFRLPESVTDLEDHFRLLMFFAFEVPSPYEFGMSWSLFPFPLFFFEFLLKLRSISRLSLFFG